MVLAFHSDKALWCAFKSGNRDALDALFRTYYPMLYSYGLRIYGDSGFIEDSLQDFFLYLFDQREKLTNLEKIKPYLFKAFRRRLLRRIGETRKEKVKQELFAHQIRDIQFSADELIIEREAAAFCGALLLEMLNSLPKRQREVIFLRYYNDLSIVEVADVLNISYQGTVNTLYKAIRALRKNEHLKRILAFLSILIHVLGLTLFHS